MSVWRFVGRLWFYFRMGYSTYLTFLLGVANTLVVVYYLLIQNVPSLQVVFPHFAFFVVISVIVGVPLKSQDLLSDEEEKRLAELEVKMETLLRGGYVGSPKRSLGF